MAGLSGPAAAYAHFVKKMGLMTIDEAAERCREEIRTMLKNLRRLLG